MGVAVDAEEDDSFERIEDLNRLARVRACPSNVLVGRYSGSLGWLALDRSSSGGLLSISIR